MSKLSRWPTAILILTLLACLPLQAQQLPKPQKPQTSPDVFWDRVFAQRPYRPMDPSRAFLAYCTGRALREGLLQPGSKTLVLAMGDGPNAIYLAQQGLEVTGLDISAVAIERAQKAASEAGVKLQTVKADLFSHDLGDGEWDLVTNIYYNPAIRVFEGIKNSVRPGGLLFVEGYGADHKGGGPPAWSRYKPNQLLVELAGWRILEYQDGTYTSPWADDRAVPVVRVLARKPAASK
jgi:SAM-dependent methyltransferase